MGWEMLVAGKVNPSYRWPTSASVGASLPFPFSVPMTSLGYGILYGLFSLLGIFLQRAELRMDSLTKGHGPCVRQHGDLSPTDLKARPQAAWATTQDFCFSLCPHYCSDVMITLYPGTGWQLPIRTLLLSTSMRVELLEKISELLLPHLGKRDSISSLRSYWEDLKNKRGQGLTTVSGMHAFTSVYWASSWKQAQW